MAGRSFVLDRRTALADLCGFVHLVAGFVVVGVMGPLDAYSRAGGDAGFAKGLKAFLGAESFWLSLPILVPVVNSIFIIWVLRRVFDRIRELEPRVWGVVRVVMLWFCMAGIVHLAFLLRLMSWLNVRETVGASARALSLRDMLGEMGPWERFVTGFHTEAFGSAYPGGLVAFHCLLWGGLLVVLAAVTRKAVRAFSPKATKCETPGEARM